MKKLVLSKKEKQDFDNLSKQEQEAYLAAAEQVRERLMTKTIVLSTLMIESIDELETFGLNKGRLKVTAKPFKDQLLKMSKRVFSSDVNEDISASIDYVAAMSEEIDKLLNSIK